MAQLTAMRYSQVEKIGVFVQLAFFQGAEGLDEGVLQDILGVGDIARHSGRPG